LQLNAIMKLFLLFADIFCVVTTLIPIRI